MSAITSARAKELNAMTTGEQPDIACILNPGLVGGSEQSFAMGMVPLHDTDEADARLSRQWIEVESKEPWIVRGNHTYPVAPLQGYGRGYVFEPGRALLLFAERLSAGITNHAKLGGGWLSDYLPAVAREVVVPTTV